MIEHIRKAHAHPIFTWLHHLHLRIFFKSWHHLLITRQSPHPPLRPGAKDHTDGFQAFAMAQEMAEIVQGQLRGNGHLNVPRGQLWEIPFMEVGV